MVVTACLRISNSAVTKGHHQLRLFLWALQRRLLQLRASSPAALERSDVRVKLVKGSPHAKKFQVTVPPDAAIVVSCEPLSVGMGAAYIAHNADATVLCISEWTDTRKQLLSTIRELELAKANIAGIAYLPEEKPVKEHKTDKAPKGE